MKKFVVIASALFFIAAVSIYAQKDKSVASPKKTTTEVVVNSNATTTSADKAAPQEPGNMRPKLSKEDSIKRQHRLDSIRKVIAERRGKEGFPVLSKEDSIKRAHKIDSLKKIAKERKQVGQNGPQPYRPRLSKEDSLKRIHQMDSLKNAAEARQKGTPAKQENK